jgi:hypothetical protein
MSEQYPPYPPGGSRPPGPPPQGSEPPYGSQPPYGQPPSQYGNPPSQYGQPPSPYGQPPSQYGNPPSQYGNPPSPYGNPPGNAPSQYGQPPQQGAPSPYGAAPSPYGAPTPGGTEPYGQPGGFGYTPEPPKKSRTSLWIAIGVVVVLLIGGGVAAYKLLAPAAKERNAHVSAPQKIGPLVQSTDPDKVKLAQSILDGIKADNAPDSPKIKESLAVYYDDSEHPDEPVFVIAATADIDNPDAALTDTFTGAGNVGNVHTVDPGSLGGSAKCGSETDAGTSLVLCAWTDHGSLGAVAFVGRESGDAENLFGQIHNAVLSRG